MDPRRLAKLLGVPYYLLSRAINEHNEQTVADLIREKRVQRAKALLDECPDATILRIALEAGFPAKSSFNDAFRKTVGMSPSEYRRQQKRLDSSSQTG
jgi:AraC-like DNA-binding protein